MSITKEILLYESIHIKFQVETEARHIITKTGYFDVVEQTMCVDNTLLQLRLHPSFVEASRSQSKPYSAPSYQQCHLHKSNIEHPSAPEMFMGDATVVMVTRGSITVLWNYRGHLGICEMFAAHFNLEFVQRSVPY